jgi:hypothetical protein
MNKVLERIERIALAILAFFAVNSATIPSANCAYGREIRKIKATQQEKQKQPSIFPLKCGKYDYSVTYEGSSIGKSSLSIDKENNRYCVRLEIEMYPAAIFQESYSRLKSYVVVAGDGIKPTEYSIKRRTKNPLMDFILNNPLLRILPIKPYKTKTYYTEVFFAQEKDEVRIEEYFKYNGKKRKERTKIIKNENISDPLAILLNFFNEDEEKYREGSFNLGRIYAKEIVDLEATLREDVDDAKVIEIELPEKAITEEKTKMKLYYSKEGGFVNINKFELYNYEMDGWITVARKSEN